MIRFVVSACLAFMTIAVVPSQATEAGWALLREGGQVVLLAHGRAPGAGDPANFDLENCRTQRNLSDAGRQQARRLGALFAARAAPIEAVYASRYCRTEETARLAFGSDPELLEALDSYANNPEMEEAWTAEILDLINGFSGSDNVIFVTHQPNIAALTGVNAREGEAIIVTPGESGLHMIGRVVFN